MVEVPDALPPGVAADPRYFDRTYRPFSRDEEALQTSRTLSNTNSFQWGAWDVSTSIFHDFSVTALWSRTKIACSPMIVFSAVLSAVRVPDGVEIKGNQLVHYPYDSFKINDISTGTFSHWIIEADGSCPSGQRYDSMMYTGGVWCDTAKRYRRTKVKVTCAARQTTGNPVIVEEYDYCSYAAM